VSDNNVVWEESVDNVDIDDSDVEEEDDGDDDDMVTSSVISC